MVSAKKKLRDEGDQSSIDEAAKMNSEEGSSRDARAKVKKRWFAFWSRGRKSSDKEEGANPNGGIFFDALSSVSGDDEESSPSTPSTAITPDYLGGVLLSAEEPTMTRQLNVLSNIRRRALIFGGDQELLLLAETLDADKPAFIQRWYKNNPTEDSDVRNETRPGVQYRRRSQSRPRTSRLVHDLARDGHPGGGQCPPPRRGGGGTTAAG